VPLRGSRSELVACRFWCNTDSRSHAGICRSYYHGCRYFCAGVNHRNVGRWSGASSIHYVFSRRTCIWTCSSCRHGGSRKNHRKSKWIV
jgi:Aluminium resistance protein